MLMSLVGEHETAQRGCSQQYAVVLGFLEAAQWTELSPGAWQWWGTLKAGEGGQAALETVELPVPPGIFGPIRVLEEDCRKPGRGACHSSFSRGRCQSAGGLCLRVHTRVCFLAAWTLPRSLSQRDRCARETPVTSHLT